MNKAKYNSTCTRDFKFLFNFIKVNCICKIHPPKNSIYTNIIILYIYYIVYKIHTHTHTQNQKWNTRN